MKYLVLVTYVTSTSNCLCKRLTVQLNQSMVKAIYMSYLFLLIEFVVSACFSHQSLGLLSGPVPKDKANRTMLHDSQFPCCCSFLYDGHEVSSTSVCSAGTGQSHRTTEVTISRLRAYWHMWIHLTLQRPPAERHLRLSG